MAAVNPVTIVLTGKILVQIGSKFREKDLQVNFDFWEKSFYPPYPLAPTSTISYIGKSFDDVYRFLYYLLLVTLALLKNEFPVKTELVTICHSIA